MAYSSVDYKILGINIAHTLEKLLPSFPLRRRLHYAERMYRISQDSKHIPVITEYVRYTLPQLTKDIKTLGNLSTMQKYGRQRLEYLNRNASPRFRKRWEFYLKQPEYKFYQQFIFQYHKIQEYGLLSLFDYDLVFEKLKEIDWKNILLSEDVVYNDPVQTVNMLYWLKDLGLGDHVDDYLLIFERVYPENKKPEAENEILNRFYAYTHLIIAHSGYYQHMLDTKTHHKYAGILEKYITNITQTKNRDLLAETGVSLKLYGELYSPTIKNIQTQLAKDIDPQTHLLKLKTQTPAAIQHANTLAVMLFTPWQKLYPGPTINKESLKL